MEKVRIAVVGSQFAARLHLQALAGLRGTKAEVVAVVSRSPANAAAFAARFGIPEHGDDYRRLLERRDVDVIDLCVPTDLHARMTIEAARAGKHVICEKPLTGYFGKGIVTGEGVAADGKAMFEETLGQCQAVAKAVEEAGVKFMYAENWIYAPAVAKLKSLLRASGGTILDLRAEQSHSGSHSPFALSWRTSGGGSLMRLGAHPVGAVLHLKHFEGMLRFGRPIRARAVTAEVGSHSRTESFLKEQKRYLVSSWEDVEDWGVMIISFEDGTHATVVSSDGVLGGVKNTLSAYCSNAVMHVNMNPSNMMEVYAPAPHIFGDEYIAEKLETKAGWNFPSPDEDWVRGYPQEMEDFVSAVLEDREPISGIALARDVVETIYAAYVSACQGRRVTLR